ncbi:A-kinase anchor protein 10, mitochondrial-like isoform X2 [Varroa jacobsoni]|nr:A-kinase anchor protein 10, mitochondrial-like isoform X2 [Varroa destructor]XP_022665900.1 A-kinase anchor protein 10, mitochondrial-like isoform X2 [Varroa destructor]XP_022699446.1 A-kinase anchor protein 10, mitochondrial-like isoform X2 [Varroa jacobsoni]XP_022699448.1 A-kinase anchor protein 10, mitochondrial-like isoform X2 [Varroa jacobsoni]XP_022699449.1 A-kinase anchor protein 10, mitochondrial-like isoform X2 [Varroa jacobsoni]
MNLLGERSLSLGSMEMRLNRGARAGISGLRRASRAAGGSVASGVQQLKVTPQERMDGVLKTESDFDPAHGPRTKACSFKSLSELLRDNGSIPYLLQFMETRGMQHLLRFWLESDMFQRSSQVLRQGQARRPLLRPSDPLQADPLSPCEDSASAIHSPKDTSPKEFVPPVYTDSIGQDALHIYNKFIGPSAVQPIPLEDGIRAEILACISQPHVEWTCFARAQRSVFDQMERDLYTDFVRSPYYTQRQIDVLTAMAAGPGLVDILANDACLFYLMEFSEEMGIRPLIDFLIVAENFASHTRAADAFAAEEAQRDAMVIYGKFFSLQADTPLGFSSVMRSQIEEAICSEDGPDARTFALPYAIVVQYLENNFLQAFFNSPLYQKFLTECIQTVQRASHGTRRGPERERDTCSSCSDTSSLSTSTQQFAGSRCHASESVSSDPTGDSRCLSSDPTGGSRCLGASGDHSLLDDKVTSSWSFSGTLRKGQQANGGLHNRPLQLLHIDQLGKLTSEFEPEPDGVTVGSGAISKLRKLVGRSDREEEEEELAWEAAHQLIREVHCLTATANNNNSTHNNNNNNHSGHDNNDEIIL